MNKTLRKRSRLLIPAFFLSSAFALAFSIFIPATRIVPSFSELRDTIYTPAQPVSDSIYRAFLTNADQLYKEQKYTECLTELEKAKALKPDVPSLQERIIRVKGLIAQQKKTAEEYSRIISRADAYFAKKDYLNAKASYQMAIDVKPDDNYAKEKLQETMELLRSQKAQNILYDVAVASADKLFDARDYEKAKQEYENALKIMSGESYPREKINQILKTQVDARVREELYKAAIASADKYFGTKSYQNALFEYKNALKQKPEEVYPKQKIEELNRILDTLRVIDESYRQAIARADQLFVDTRYAGARKEYEGALIIKPNESYPANRIREIDRILAGIARTNADFEYVLSLADSLYVAKDFIRAYQHYQQALQIKPDESYPKAMLAKTQTCINEQETNMLTLEATYQAALKNADRLFGEKAYPEARTEYQSALQLKPGENYPKEKITEIDGILETLLAQQQKELEDSYNAVISEANKLFGVQSYEPARTAYQKALDLKPAAALPAQRIQFIDSLLQAVADEQILTEQYQKLIGIAESQFRNTEYLLARQTYTEAKTRKPKEPYPDQKIAQIDRILSEMARQKQLDQQYVAIVRKGDSLFGQKSYALAKTEFLTAATLKPGELYPKEKIAQIDQIFKDEIARQQRIDAEYNSLIGKADLAFAAKSYDSARSVFSKAGELKPEQAYWKERIAEIDQITAEIRKRNETYQTAVAKADGLLASAQYETAREEYQNASAIKPAETYPKEKVSEINRILAELEGKKQTYDKLVSNGDQFLAMKEYTKARDKYRQALDIFPEEAYPKDKIRFATTRIDSIYRANKADYDRAVGEGDGFFNTFEYDKAIDAYTRALAFLPMEEYPRQMIAKIRKTIAENAIADVLSTPVIIRAGEEQKFTFNPVNVATRRNNFIYLKVKTLSGASFNILLRYGKDAKTSGGLAIRNITTDGEAHERLISVKDQDPWFREDNNWISLYPQGGDIEVSFIQVSRAID
ncbi:MAG: hypothetical protein V1733_05855 [bacterium]